MPADPFLFFFQKVLAIHTSSSAGVNREPNITSEMQIGNFWARVDSPVHVHVRSIVGGCVGSHDDVDSNFSSLGPCLPLDFLGAITSGVTGRSQIL